MDKTHVIVEFESDGTIVAVYGPFTKDYADARSKELRTNSVNRFAVRWLIAILTE